MKLLLLFTTFVVLLQREKLDHVYIKCFPFSMKTTIPITESTLAKQVPSKMNFLKEKKSTKNVLKSYKLLKSIVANSGEIVDDYDLRALVKFQLQNGQTDVFYVCWDKKNIRYKNKLYKVSKDNIQKLFVDLSFPCQ